MTIIMKLIEQIELSAILEILAISTVFYYISLWLSKDRTQRLLLYFYGYCIITLTSSLLNLPLLSYICTYYAPTFAMIFILIHKKTLQKNFVAFRRYKPAQKFSDQWHKKLMQCLLLNKNQGKSVHVIIEQSTSLEGLLSSPFIIDTTFQTELMQTLIKSELFEQEKCIWIHNDGKIIGINVQLANPTKMIVDETIKDLPLWKQDAIMLGKSTDAFIISNEQQKDGFTIIANESINTGISAENCLKILKKQIMQTSSKGSLLYEKTKQQEKQKSSP